MNKSINQSINQPSLYPHITIRPSSTRHPVAPLRQSPITPLDHYARHPIRPSSTRPLRPSSTPPVDYYARHPIRPSSTITLVFHYAPRPLRPSSLSSSDIGTPASPIHHLRG
ncbi:hypothetical protein I7I51_06914 [Histoplasma capsulatum]|uniref:Uncharacterized protein n=1 Tax=Ajellomyces capsulatus TaxID=5037 RepID=A0A8A1MN59_AJECA|nr:hypothetical protein I7I51_06914 [Histoplasma capsulatum]